MKLALKLLDYWQGVLKKTTGTKYNRQNQRASFRPIKIQCCRNRKYI